MNRSVKVRLGVAAVVLGSLAGACAVPPGSSPVRTTAATATRAVTGTATQAATGTPGPSAVSVPASPPPAAGTGIAVPDVSGLNHQDAQNAMQAAGLYNLREVDSTGGHRAMIIDRNWCQTGQDPKPGAKVAVHTVITLYARKCDEH